MPIFLSTPIAALLLTWLVQRRSAQPSGWRGGLLAMLLLTAALQFPAWAAWDLYSLVADRGQIEHGLALLAFTGPISFVILRQIWRMV